MTNFKINKVWNATMIWVNNVSINKGFTLFGSDGIGLVNSIWFDTELVHIERYASDFCLLWPEFILTIVRHDDFNFLSFRSASSHQIIEPRSTLLFSRRINSWWNQLDRKLDFLSSHFQPLRHLLNVCISTFLSHCRAQNDLHSSKLNIDKIPSRNIDEGFFTSRKSRHVISWNDARFMLAVNNKWQINRSIRVGRHKIPPSYKFAFIFSSL